MRRLPSLVRLWEQLQVELHGQYSVARFEALVQYQSRHTSLLRALAIALLGPVPILVLIVSVDALPLVPTSEGSDKQNFFFWLRVFLIGWFFPFTLIYETWIVVPVLPMSTVRLCVISTISGLNTCAWGVVLNKIVGFPIPFAIEFETGPFISLLATALWLSWKHALRNNSLARQSFNRYLKVLATQLVMLHTYIGFTLAFNQLYGLHQTLRSGILPLIKLFFKSCINNGVFHLEDLSPTVVVFFVDIFHALFVSFTMQQASANGANVVVMVVDVIQNCIAYYELSQMLDRIHVLVDWDTKRKSSTRQHRGNESSVRLTVSAIDYAAYVLHTDEKVRNHPRIALPRHSRGSDARLTIVAPDRKIHPRKASPSSVSPSINDPPLELQLATPCLTDATDTSRLSQKSLRHVEYTKCVLKLLLMVEFYVLVEYVEAMLSVSYGTC